MTDWTAGYVADIGYTFGYYQELNPMRVRMAFLFAGLECPEMGAACELGYGQGMSANLHAAASVTTWHGTDFNPSQAGFAQELATASGSEARLYDEAFADFAQRSDLPEFDYIGLHGIWSWISDENRAVIVDFIRRKLKVGGVLYISYNTQPGWAAFAPVRHLMTEHAKVIGSEGHGIVSRIEGALDFTEKLLTTNPAYARANPQIVDRIKKLNDQNRHYLAHEYFNRDWHPMHFATMAEWLAPAKVQYACSAHYLDHLEAVNLTVEQQTFLKEIPDAMLRESVRDFMVNQQFRRDYWVKGARSLSALDQAEAFRAHRVMLVTHRSEVALKVSGALGEATLTESVYGPVLDFLADHKPRRLSEIEQAVKARGVTFSQVVQVVMMMTGALHFAAVQEEEVVARSSKAASLLNLHLIRKSRGAADIGYLASPLTGGGVPVSRFHQLFLLAIVEGRGQPEEWVDFVWNLLASQGQKILREGKPLESEGDNRAELLIRATEFAEKQLPILKALQIA